MNNTWYKWIQYSFKFYFAFVILKNLDNLHVHWLTWESFQKPEELQDLQLISGSHPKQMACVSSIKQQCNSPYNISG